MTDSRVRAAVVIVALSLLGAGAEASRSASAASRLAPLEGTFVFSCSGCPQNQSGPSLFVVRATGAGFREIVHSRSGTGSPSDSVAPYDPRWSPGGASVAFSNGFAEIWRVNPATRALRRITRSSIERDREPAWSPDGKRLVYAQHCSLVTRPVSDGKTRLLARWPGSTSCFGAPDWSPDGQRVVFDRNGQQLFMINADGLGLRPLTPRGDFARFPRWSPDGKQIAFITGASLSVMKADGSQRRTIVQRDGLNFNVNPAWSPNGHRIAFVVTNTFDVQQDLKGNEIYTVRLDGRDARPIHIPQLPPNVWSDIDGLDWR